MTMKPTIGRKVWYWHGDPSMNGPMRRFDASQPFDATVIYVWSDTHVNLKVTDHDGNDHVVKSVRLRNPDGSEGHGTGFGHNVATWMPYQIGQANKTRPADIELKRIDDPLPTHGWTGPIAGFNDKDIFDELAAGEIVDAEITSGGGGDFAGGGAEGSFDKMEIIGEDDSGTGTPTEQDADGQRGEPSSSGDTDTSGDTASDASPSSSN